MNIRKKQFPVGQSGAEAQVLAQVPRNFEDDILDLDGTITTFEYV